MARLTQEELAGMLPERRRDYEKRLKKVRRNRLIFAAFISMLILVITVLVLSLTVFFKIDTIKVNGTSRYDAQQIIETSGIEKGKNLFLSGVNKAKENISSKLTYLSEVNILRKLPSTIVIEVVGADAEYCYSTSGGYALADSKGRVLEIVNADDIPEKTAVIKTKNTFTAVVGEQIEIIKDKDEGKAAAAEKEHELVKKVLIAIDESKIQDVTEIDVTTPTSIYVTYQDRFRLNLGNSYELTYKLKSAVQIIIQEDEISTSTSGEINLTNPGNAYVSPDNNN